MIAINKPAGLVVHAGAGAHSGTLVNRLVHHFKRSRRWAATCGRASCIGWTKDTSGVLLVARTDAAHRHLAAQFAARTVEKIYLALVQGVRARGFGPHHEADRARSRRGARA